MSPARSSTPPPDGRAPLLAAACGEERARTEETGRLSAELALELKRLGSHPLSEARRLEHEVLAGENPATPLILIAGIAPALWSFVALVVGVALLVAHVVA